MALLEVIIFLAAIFWLSRFKPRTRQRYTTYKAMSGPKSVSTLEIYAGNKYALTVRKKRLDNNPSFAVVEMGTYMYGKNSLTLISDAGKTRLFRVDSTFLLPTSVLPSGERLVLLQEDSAIEDAYSVKNLMFEKRIRAIPFIG